MRDNNVIPLQSRAPCTRFAAWRIYGIPLRNGLEAFAASALHTPVITMLAFTMVSRAWVMSAGDARTATR